ncbi:mucin-associated surface protein (MASP), putative [Trypanosoma cruzi marinkellei]|uniref:Mucin-associated surface protein (MASP), putative n=1 Tax=Trypanosoma cruzi marinkellei TaxID=85056 RepID=K2M3C3_TRYCR|nr:mucin-associated surface protein (MASP), putative [Trypanosoma cruzi marinkellei]
MGRGVWLCDLSLSFCFLLCVDGLLVCAEGCTQVTGVMAMMMTGRVLLVCALCVLWCGSAGSSAEDIADVASLPDVPASGIGVSQEATHLVKTLPVIPDSETETANVKGELPLMSETEHSGSSGKDDAPEEDEYVNDGNSGEEEVKKQHGQISLVLPAGDNNFSTGVGDAGGRASTTSGSSGDSTASTEGRREKADFAAGNTVTGELTQQTTLKLTPGGDVEPRDVLSPTNSRSQETVETQGQSSKQQETSLGTQQQVTELRPLLQDGKTSCKANEIPQKPGDISTQPDTRQATISVVQGQILQSSRLLLGAVTASHQSVQNPETILSTTQQDDAAKQEKERQSEETGGTQREAHEGSETAPAIITATNGVATPHDSESSPAATSSVRCITGTEGNLTTNDLRPLSAEDAASLSNTHEAESASESTENAAAQIAGSETAPITTAKTNDTTTSGDSDSSTAASLTTSPLLLLVVVACAAVAAVVAA